MSKTGNRQEAFGAYYFTVEVEGLQSAYFRSCTGLKSESEVVEVAEGGLNTTTHKLIGRTKFPNIVLKQGFSNSTLWNMRDAFLKDEPGANLKRFNGTIIQMGPGQRKVAKWRFEKGWVCKWEGPDFDASKNEVSIESIEIAHEKLSYVGGDQ